MKKQLLLLLFSLFAVMGYARTVTGVVTSARFGTACYFINPIFAAKTT